MRILNSLIENPWLAALGLTILHSLWQGLIAAVVLALLVLANRSPRVRYLAGCALVLALFVSSLVTFLYLAPGFASGERVVAPLHFTGWNRVLPFAGSSERLDLNAVAPWLAALWLFGVFVFYLRYAAGFFALSTLRNKGVCASSEEWQRKLAALSARLHLSAPVQLIESTLATTPMVIGHLRPIILMPIGLLTSLPTAHIEAILLHELAHIRRHDFLVNTVQNLLDGLFFYHPAVWWISRLIRSEREKCCDDIAVQLTGSAPEYARALAALEETRWSDPQPALAAKGGSLMKRIHRLLYPSVPSTSWTPLLAVGLALFATTVTLGAWQPAAQADTQTSLATIQSDAYTKWLNEDVVYIIDDAERTAFLKLTTDEERSHFVEQFWDRRNPEPGSRENKFKQEHYRRIAYANAHFISGVPGWKTDRGHMYILYGPPDEIDSHPKGAPHPWEQWGYRNPDNPTGMNFFYFVDTHGTGNFRLAPSPGR